MKKNDHFVSIHAANRVTKNWNWVMIEYSTFLYSLRRMHSASLFKVREPCLVVLLTTKLLIASQIFLRP